MIITWPVGRQQTELDPADDHRPASSLLMVDRALGTLHSSVQVTRIS